MAKIIPFPKRNTEKKAKLTAEDIQKLVESMHEIFPPRLANIYVAITVYEMESD